MKMKKLVIAALVILPFASCVSRKSADILVAQKDSLAVVVSEKDAIIDDVFISLNQIAENLNAIKEREKIVESSAANREIRLDATSRISSDIAAIDRLLAENRETIARLERNVQLLRNANVQIASLENLVKELSAQINTKDGEITELKGYIEHLSTEVSGLNTRVEGLSSTVEQLSADNTQLERQVYATTTQLNTVHYIVGSERELMNKEIVYKSGFIGRTLRMTDNRTLNGFAQVDMRSLNEIIIGQRNVTVVTTHPADSYEMVMAGNVYSSLMITNPEKFWEYSKVLVVCYR